MNNRHSYIQDCAGETPEDRARTIKNCVAALRAWDKEHPFDCIAFRGMSGAIVAPVLAHILKKDLFLIRKVGENSHSSNLCEGRIDVARYVIVDDLIDTGRTVRNILQCISNDLNPFHECVGILLYERANPNRYSYRRTSPAYFAAFEGKSISYVTIPKGR